MKSYVSIILGDYTFLIAVCVHQSLALKLSDGGRGYVVQ